MVHKVLGEGTYGCVIKPSLKCKSDKNINYEGRVSKILRDDDAVGEMNEMEKLKHVKGLSKYSIQTPILCKPKLDDKFKAAVSKCKISRVSKTRDIRHLSQLLIDDGGVDLYEFSNHIYDKLSLHDQHIFMTSILQLFKGLKFFADNNIIHQDIKSMNIVYNVVTGKMRYIDFGLVVSKTKFIEDSKKNNYHFAQSWAYYPPEFSCANKSVFENRQKCMSLKTNYNRNHEYFIQDLANSFDSYCLSHALSLLIASIYSSPENKVDLAFLRKFNSLMNSYSEPDLLTRSMDLDHLITTYEKILHEFDIYTSPGTAQPSPKIIKMASELSVHTQSINKNIECPKSLPEYNPKTKKCVKKCKEGKVRNNNYRCVNPLKIKSMDLINIANEVTKTETPIKSQKDKSKDLINVANDVTKTETPIKPRKCPKSLPDYNPKTKKCVKKCKEGKVRNNKFRCVKTQKNKKTM